MCALRLPRLEAVVLLGKKAQAAYKLVKPSILVSVYGTYHPSAQVINRIQGSREGILGTFREIAVALGGK